MKFNEQKQELATEKQFELYKIALETRNFEISLFWQRSNYFLILNTALSIGFFRLNTDSWYAIMISTIGIIVSFFWLRVNLGGKFWQTRWEEKIKVLENKIFPNINFFASGKEIKSDVKNNLNKKSWCDFYNRKVDKEILKKYSVSRTMIDLSVVFILSWCILFIIHVYQKACFFGFV